MKKFPWPDIVWFVIIFVFVVLVNLTESTVNIRIFFASIWSVFGFFLGGNIMR